MSSMFCTNLVVTVRNLATPLYQRAPVLRGEPAQRIRVLGGVGGPFVVWTGPVDRKVGIGERRVCAGQRGPHRPEGMHAWKNRDVRRVAGNYDIPSCS